MLKDRYGRYSGPFFSIRFYDMAATFSVTRTLSPPLPFAYKIKAKLWPILFMICMCGRPQFGFHFMANKEEEWLVLDSRYTCLLL